ncbi:piggyBac transposable element-derived protein 4-like [Hydra vulgaris]|uniref:PiggyBac transposable element-derived protein 4-like n=1 Tax=Hydra vulgaris TaxID=6087 RepID=A0ABM4DMW5_HYDVU
MKLKPGLTPYAIRMTNSINIAFQLFFTPKIFKIVLTNSNKECEIVFKEKWAPISENELNGFLGILFLAGVYRSAGEATEELWDISDGRQIFRWVMSRLRFHTISRVLRFDDKATRLLKRNNDKFAPIRVVFDVWVQTLSNSFRPYENVTVDEELVPFRGRCSFRQYIKSKPAKYGLKLWLLCDSSTSYVLNAQIYTGRIHGEGPERNQGHRVVHDLVEVIKGSGRNVTMDNFFTSVTLAKELLEKKLSLVGTMRKKKKEIPTEFLPARTREVYSSLFGHQKQLTLVSYVPKKGKSVILLSSNHCDAELSNRPDKKPQIILDYNSTKPPFVEF